MPYFTSRSPKFPFPAVRAFILITNVAIRFYHWAIRWLSIVLLLGAAWATPLYAAEGVEIRYTQIESSEDGFRLAAAYNFELNRGLEDALQRGIALYFTTEVDITRPRWYWFDENTLTASQTVKVSYNVLTRQYHVAIGGNLHQSFTNQEDALSVIRRPGRWIVAERGALKPGSTYLAAVRMRLDVAQLPKPFQINALNNSDWHLSSDWKTFSFRVE
ncbi:MAG: DUF4390 domain-containing protein [Burkholderiales bacterium]|nr:DUF4390 domain-containing protein [Burkholderiales bacterium]